jgi:hypothetical protein
VIHSPMRFFLFAACWILTGLSPASAQKTHNSPWSFPEVESRAAWEARAKDIREQILVSCGLSPLPEKSPLKATVFGKVEREGYSIEKVHLHPYPGFYLAGNLYRPLGKGAGPFPAVLNPHGHWDTGRLADEENGSIPARCIGFARMGMIAFSYDMVGYNDTRFADWPEGGDGHRSYGSRPEDQLWGINPMGLQLWNSIRALDFLESLPDVDRKRLACAGESGGATQTFMLGAVDSRLAAQVPVVMVSHSMQGGCICENAPGLRVNYSNMEIAAAAAPRPQLLVGATGDWTKTTIEVEGPAVAGIYKLFGAEERLKYLCFEAPHNYNRASREAVYDWLGHRLLEHPEAVSFKEAPYTKEPDGALRVFPGGKLPADALTMADFIEARKQAQREHWEKLVPKEAAGFERFKAVMFPAWRRTLQTTWTFAERNEKKPPPADWAAREQLEGTVVIKVADVPARKRNELQIEQGDGVTMLTFDHVLGSDPADEISNHFTTYNRTALQKHVGALITLCQMVRSLPAVNRVVLSGSGRGSLWALLAAPAADAVAVDCEGLDFSSDEDLLATGSFAPGLRCIGTFQGAAMLAAPNPLLLHNTGGKFAEEDIAAAYRATGGENRLAVTKVLRSEGEILRWAAQK